MTTLLVIIYVSFISLGLPDSILGSVWPAMQPDLGAPLALAGYISMTVTAGTIVSSFCCDWAVGRFGTGKVTAASTVLTALALAGFSFAPNVVCLFLCAIPLGLGAGCVDAALNNFVALHYEAKHMNWLHCFWGIGASAGPMLVTLTLRLGGSWRSGYGVISGLQALLCLALIASQKLWKVEKAELQAAEAAPTYNKMELLRKPGVLAVLGGFIFYCASEATAGLWSTSFLHHRFGVAAENAAIASTFFYTAITIGRMLSGFLAQKLNEEAMIRLGVCILVGGAVVTLVAPVPAVALIGIGMMGLGCAPIYPSMLHLTPKRFGADCSQSIIGMEMALAYTGSTCFPPLFGSLTEVLGVGFYPFYLLMLGIGLLVSTELTRRQLRNQRVK